MRECKSPYLHVLLGVIQQSNRFKWTEESAKIRYDAMDCFLHVTSSLSELSIITLHFPTWSLHANHNWHEEVKEIGLEMLIENCIGLWYVMSLSHWSQCIKDNVKYFGKYLWMLVQSFLSLFFSWSDQW